MLYIISKLYDWSKVHSLVLDNDIELCDLMAHEQCTSLAEIMLIVLHHCL